MSLKDYRFDGEEKLELRGMNTGAKKDGVDKEDILRRTEKNLGRIEALQDKLYADGRESVLIILQAMDAAGKDSTVKHVMGCVNPQGIDVHSFKQPTSEELSHDYLWRAMKALPARGKMALFNRSYYEDVLVVKVHALQKNYKMPARVLEDPDFFKKRYRQIRHFEEYLYENGCRVVKIFLNLSREKQKERFLERIQVEAKNWKFSQADIRERAYWNDYMDAYEVAVNETATRHSPWYVIPADQKWYTRYLVSEAVLGVLEDIDPHYPKLPPEHAAELQECREALENEGHGLPHRKRTKKGVSPAASLRRKRPSASLGGDGSKDRPGRSDGGFEHTLFHQLAAAPCAEHHAQAAPLCGRARQSGVQPHAAPEGCLDLPAAVCTRTAQLGDDGARTAARGTHACPDVQCISAGSGCFAARGAVRRFDPFARRQLRPQRARTGCGRRRA